MNTIGDFIGITGIVVTIVGIVGGWINHALGLLRSQVAALDKKMTAVMTRLVPEGGTPLDVRVTALEQDMAIIKSKGTQ